MNFQLSPIEAHEKKIDQIFSDAYAFEIPPYQRPYAWEEDQARELLSDLVDAMDNQHLSGGVYFLGSIVLVKSPNDPNSKVIDGQQRLTTLTILLSILRDLTSDEDRKYERRAYVFQKANAERTEHLPRMVRYTALKMTISELRARCRNGTQAADHHTGTDIQHNGAIFYWVVSGRFLFWDAWISKERMLSRPTR